jgi:hypothetical protein
LSVASCQRFLARSLTRIPGEFTRTRALVVFLASDLAVGTDPAKRILLRELPRLFRGYGRNPGVDAVVVVLESDTRNCADFLSELNKLAVHCDPKPPKVLFRLAIEEVEAWYFGDRDAVITAYPRAKQQVLDRYVQDSVCGTWETLADAIFPGGSTALRKAGWPLMNPLIFTGLEKA